MQVLYDVLRRGEGDTDSIVFNVVTKDAKGKPTPKDVTGWTFVITFNTEKEPADITNEIGKVTGNMDLAASGKVVFPMTGVTLPVGTVYFDVRSRDDTGADKKRLIGEITVTRDIGKSFV